MVVTRRGNYELRESRDRGLVLEVLAVALANIDEFIALIKAAPTPPVARTELMSRTWDSELVRGMLSRTGEGAAAYRPVGLDAQYGLQADGLYRLSETQAEQTTVATTGVWSTVTVDMGVNGKWVYGGRVNQIRVDPATNGNSGSADLITIDRVWFE